ncbi:hypothetical protein PM10SUCC1_28980 [Propionigenium maris DSM 9537]|uniref:Uncharacterized protein n=1 Tax=Propionigenium maris DSM 9537 TaxID=1123000 RepID=A0A9W6GLN6_9FUSO|nr:hypothetical protein PM10SUCC1_28980 [Propionigenium maris DSM 9537]
MNYIVPLLYGDFNINNAYVDESFDIGNVRWRRDIGNVFINVETESLKKLALVSLIVIF